MRVACLFTHENAREVDGVIDLLRSYGIGIERYNLCAFPEQLVLSIDPQAAWDPKIKRCGWFHNTGDWSFCRSLTGLEREVAARECRAFVQGFSKLAPVCWLNSPDAIELAANKPFQLGVAKKLGVRIPDTVITNDPKRLNAFARTHHRVVMKSLENSFVQYGEGEPLKFYTQDVTDQIEDIAKELSLCPAIFQELLPKKLEVRVTVVAGKCYSIAMDCAGLPSEIVDVRELNYQSEKARFRRALDLDRVEEWSIQIVKALGLSYAGLDWVVSPDGTPFFLEANACGSFKWFELCGAGAVTRAIAQALADRCV